MLSATTLRNYTGAINRLEGAELTLSDYDTVVEWITALNRGLETKKLYYNALANYFRTSNPELAERYREQMRPLVRELTSESRTQRLTDSEREKYLPYDDIQAVFEKAEDCPFITLEDKILLGFYTQMAPVRSDYSKLAIYINKEPDMKVNHIQICGSIYDFESCCMTVRIVEHKTASSSGILERNVPKFVRALVNKFISDYRSCFGKKPKYLFDFPPAEITVRLQRVFQLLTGKAISVNIIRHAYITKQMDGRPALSQLEAEAAELGHSVLTHEKYRRLDA